MSNEYNRINRIRSLSQEMNDSNKFNIDFSGKSNKKNRKENKKREVTFSLMGNVKINDLMSPKKFYKDYYMKYVTKGFNVDKSNGDKKFER